MALSPSEADRVDIVRSLFASGLDSADIAFATRDRESEVMRLLALGREQARAA